MSRPGSARSSRALNPKARPPPLAPPKKSKAPTTRYSALAKITKIGLQFDKRYSLYYKDAREMSDFQCYEAMFPLTVLYHDKPFSVHGGTWRSSNLFPLDFPWELRDYITSEQWINCTDEVAAIQEKYNERRANLWRLMVERVEVPARFRYTSYVMNFRPFPCKCWYRTKGRESNFSVLIYLLECLMAILRILPAFFVFLIGYVVDMYSNNLVHDLEKKNIRVPISDRYMMSIQI
jgi:hypothetical protein